MINEEVGYLKVSRFSANTYDEFKEALENLKNEGMKKLILDLQSNPGGYLDKAVRMADEFLKDNEMIVYTKGKQPKYDSEHRATTKGEFEEKPLIVLINEGSASASEIVAGALQDNDRALIVGRRSFGKGLVQLAVQLGDGSEIRLTISRYYTPSGRSIQRPYDDGLEEYQMDRMARFEHGEFFVEDSIKFADSLKYTTTQGRVVYGGGGIMPDYFVPLDTSYNSEYLRKLVNNNVIREYAINYYERHKKALEQMSFSEYKEEFVITDQMMRELIEAGKAVNIAFNQKEYQRSENIIKTQIKALIARSEWGEQGYYPIMNEADEIYQEALTLFAEAQKLASQEN
jgi:carboxyl-terminal processing protease